MGQKREGTEFLLQNSSLPDHISDELYESVRTMPREDYLNLSTEKQDFRGLFEQKYLIDKDEAEKKARDAASMKAHQEKMDKWMAEKAAKKKAESEKAEKEKRENENR